MTHFRMTTHFRNECEHGIVYGQCRCPDANKSIVRVPCVDDEAHRAATAEPLFTKVDDEAGTNGHAETAVDHRAALQEQCACGHQRTAHVFLRAQCVTGDGCTGFEAATDATAAPVFEGFTEAELKRKPGMPVRLSENVVVTPDAITALVGDELRAVLVDQRNEARDALAALRSRIEALHSPMQTSVGGGVMCAECDLSYPCSTLLALRAKP